MGMGEEDLSWSKEESVCPEDGNCVCLRFRSFSRCFCFSSLALAISFEMAATNIRSSMFSMVAVSRVYTERVISSGMTEMVCTILLMRRESLIGSPCASCSNKSVLYLMMQLHHIQQLPGQHPRHRQSYQLRRGLPIPSAGLLLPP